jgi:hypothetical protein
MPHAQHIHNGADGNQLDSVIYADVQGSWNPSGLMDGALTFTVGVDKREAADLFLV